MAVLQSGCDGRNESHIMRMRSILSSLTEAVATNLYPGMPPVRIEKQYLVLEVCLGEVNRPVQIGIPGLTVSVSPFEGELLHHLRLAPVHLVSLDRLGHQSKLAFE